MSLGLLKSKPEKLASEWALNTQLQLLFSGSHMVVMFNLLIPFSTMCFPVPDPNLEDVRISGTEVDVTVTIPAVGPATVTFNIMDDMATGEANETYNLAMIPTDTTVFVQRRFTNITITDDVDSM